MLRHRIFGAAVIALLAAAAPACAQDDIAAKAQACAACHGQNGVPLDPKTMPIIWGQQANYLYKELHDFHSGDRASPVMAPLVKEFTLPQLRELANYFAAKTWPAATPPSPPPAPPEGIAMCKACHQQNFEGGQPAPRIAGLSSEYLAAAMHAFADDQRTNNGDMPKFMKALTESQRDAIARYLSAL
jgi:cytochrome c553